MYFSAFVNLNAGSSPQVIVYVTGPGWCGSGGCTLLILAPEHSSWKVVTRTDIIRPPIRMLRSKTNGWHDLSVFFQGGGVQPQSGYTAKLKFDGKTYAGGEVPRLSGKIVGEVVVPTNAQGTLLYP
jgi:hypothetical protein